MKAKKCIKCCEIKPICGFRLRKDTGKYRGTCIVCDKECNRKNSAKNRAEPVEKRKERLAKKDWELKNGIKVCSKCNETKSICEFELRKDTGKYRGSCKKCKLEYDKVYQTDNREIILQKARERNRKNPEANRTRVKKWKKDNPDRVKINRVKEYENRKEKYHSDEEYRNKHKKSVIEWRSRNPDKVKEYRKINNSRLDVRITGNLRSRLRAAIKNNYKNGSAVRDLGCSISEFKKYLESLWQSGMTWGNYGLYGWHIDHINPLSSFDLTDMDQFFTACHYTNLQPLWAIDNLKKGSKTS